MLVKVSNNIGNIWAPKVYISYYEDNYNFVKKMVSRLFNIGIFDIYYLDNHEDVNKEEIKNILNEITLVIINSNDEYFAHLDSFAYQVENKYCLEHKIDCFVVIDNKNKEKYEEHFSHCWYFSLDGDINDYRHIDNENFITSIIQRIYTHIDHDDINHYLDNVKKALPKEKAYYLISIFFEKEIGEIKEEDSCYFDIWFNFLINNEEWYAYFKKSSFFSYISNFFKSSVFKDNALKFKDYLSLLKNIVISYSSYCAYNLLDPEKYWDDEVQKTFAIYHLMNYYFMVFCYNKLETHEYELINQEYDDLVSIIKSLSDSKIVREDLNEYTLLESFITDKHIKEIYPEFIKEKYVRYLEKLEEVKNKGGEMSNTFESILETIDLYSEMSIEKQNRYLDLLFSLLKWINKANVSWFTGYFRGSAPEIWGDKTFDGLFIHAVISKAYQKEELIDDIHEKMYCCLTSALGYDDNYENVKDRYYAQYLLVFSLFIRQQINENHDKLNINYFNNNIPSEDYIPNILPLIDLIPFKDVRIEMFASVLYILNRIKKEEIFKKFYDDFIHQYQDKEELSLIEEKLKELSNSLK